LLAILLAILLINAKMFVVTQKDVRPECFKEIDKTYIWYNFLRVSNFYKTL